MTEKPWQSKTLWGGLIMAVIIVLQLTDNKVAGEVLDEQASVIVDWIIGGVGILLVIWGRLTAEKKIVIT
jgi:hypothetical protein